MPALGACLGTPTASGSITMDSLQQGLAAASFFLHPVEAQCDHHMASKGCNTSLSCRSALAVPDL